MCVVVGTKMIALCQSVCIESMDRLYWIWQYVCPCCSELDLIPWIVTFVISLTAGIEVRVHLKALRIN